MISSKEFNRRLRMLAETLKWVQDHTNGAEYAPLLVKHLEKVQGIRDARNITEEAIDKALRALRDEHEILQIGVTDILEELGRCIVAGASLLNCVMLGRFSVPRDEIETVLDKIQAIETLLTSALRSAKVIHKHLESQMDVVDQKEEIFG